MTHKEATNTQNLSNILYSGYNGDKPNWFKFLLGRADIVERLCFKLIHVLLISPGSVANWFVLMLQVSELKGRRPSLDHQVVQQ